ncbi:hypothetical protein [Actinomyces bowdenii]|uniref:Uncharacterized protein n=1 Tax=Actinomyces bowdenii TaxID=131109 RepID=A0A3P1V975_9ACTO|nr:hypothetical protein [Actinomyces bowdenii]RRD30318.1 hypothetical protein EII10_02560 [Actinomyces bowdenii]
MRIQRTLIGTALAAVAALGLAACSGSDSSTDNATTPAPAQTSVKDDASAKPSSGGAGGAMTDEPGGTGGDSTMAPGGDSGGLGGDQGGQGGGADGQGQDGGVGGDSASQAPENGGGLG